MSDVPRPQGQCPECGRDIWNDKCLWVRAASGLRPIHLECYIKQLDEAAASARPPEPDATVSE